MADLGGDLSLAIQALQDILHDPMRGAEIAQTALAELVRRRMGLAIVEEGRVPVRIPALAEGQAGWAKWVIGADPTERGGYMFDGPFLPLGQVSPVPVAAVVLIAIGTINSQRQRRIDAATAWFVGRNGELLDPKHAVRTEWDKLATRIDQYLRAQSEAPLLNRGGLRTL